MRNLCDRKYQVFNLIKKRYNSNLEEKTKKSTIKSFCDMLAWKSDKDIAKSVTWNEK